MASNKSDDDTYHRIRVETFPKAENPEEGYTIATLGAQVLVTDCHATTLYKANNESGLFRPSAGALEALRKDHDDLPIPAMMLLKACKAHYAKGTVF